MGGLLLTVTLGGLGMFLLVMAFSFLAAQIVSKQQDFNGVSDLEDILGDHREGNIDGCDEKEIFIIDNSECESNGAFSREEVGVPAAERSKEEMRRWSGERVEGRRPGCERLDFGRLGSR